MPHVYMILAKRMRQLCVDCNSDAVINKVSSKQIKEIWLTNIGLAMDTSRKLQYLAERDASKGLSDLPEERTERQNELLATSLQVISGLEEFLHLASKGEMQYDIEDY